MGLAYDWPTRSIISPPEGRSDVTDFEKRSDIAEEIENKLLTYLPRRHERTVEKNGWLTFPASRRARDAKEPASEDNIFPKLIYGEGPPINFSAREINFDHVVVILAKLTAGKHSDYTDGGRLRWESKLSRSSSFQRMLSKISEFGISEHR